MARQHHMRGVLALLYSFAVIDPLAAFVVSAKVYPALSLRQWTHARAHSRRPISTCVAQEMASFPPFDLAAYLRRIGLEGGEYVNTQRNRPSYRTLTEVMAAQSRAIPFENIDVVLGQTIAISPSEVEQKLVGSGRGGYCFEQNQLLASALLTLGYDVVPMLCRVRWNKKPDEHTTFTHVALAVKLGGEGSADGGTARTYLADVGFAGTNSIAPVLLGSDEIQALPEGLFRTVSNDGVTSIFPAAPHRHLPCAHTHSYSQSQSQKSMT